MRFIPLIIFVFALVACRESSAPSGETDFGALYSVDVEAEKPEVRGGKLHVTLWFASCGTTHEFELIHRERSTNAVVWIRKITPDAYCDMAASQRETFVLPAAVLSAPRVFLRLPDNSSFPLALR